MVSLNQVSPFAPSERLQQSIDIAIRRLLSSEDNPLALALYLWVAERHKVTLINGGGLVSWGISWLRQVFIERRISVRRDEDIASASLAAIALIDSPSFSPLRDEVRSGVGALLAEESQRSLIPFRRPSYGALFLLAARRLGVDQPTNPEAARAIARAYLQALAGGRLFGIAFCVQLLQEIRDDDTLHELEKPLLKAIENSRVQFEDHLYACQAVQELQSKTGVSDEMVRLIDEVVSKSPAQMYLMVGMEDMPPAGDDHVPITVSHLYRASLLDVATKNQELVLKQQKLQMIARYQGSKFVTRSAFAFPTIVFLAMWGWLLYKTLPHMRAGVRFWLRQDDAVMSFSFALVILGASFLLPYLAHVGIIVISTLYSVLIRSNIQSDEWIKDELKPKLWAATKWWGIAIGLAVILGIFVNVISPRFEDRLNINGPMNRR